MSFKSMQKHAVEFARDIVTSAPLLPGDWRLLMTKAQNEAADFLIEMGSAERHPSHPFAKLKDDVSA